MTWLHFETYLFDNYQINKHKLSIFKDKILLQIVIKLLSKKIINHKIWVAVVQIM